ncbi:MAG: winged helix-turn-helix domain-containing tetratricopeptide repeat protein, partial [Pyrinomonadaceae bacterium]
METAENKRFVYEFGKFVLDPQEKTLFADGKAIHLPAKEFETLLLLVENNGKALSKDEMMQAIWEDAFVEETNLAKQISRLRKLFNASGEEFIETLPKHGYRFSADVNHIAQPFGETILEKRTVKRLTVKLEENSEALPPLLPAAKRKFPLPAIFGVASILLAVVSVIWFWSGTKTPAKINSIAVLPLRPLTEAENSKTLGLGLTDTLIMKIGGLRQITVRPISAVTPFADAPQDALEIGKKLNVDAVLEGTIQQSEGRVRLNARLLRVENGEQIWAEQFESEAAQIFDLQDRLTAQTAQALKLKLGASETEQITKRFTNNTEALDAYLKGRYFSNRRTVGDLKTAIGYFNEAIVKDPNYALAYVGLADAYSLLADYDGALPADAYPKAKEAATKALELDDELAEAHTSLAYVKMFYYHDWQGAQDGYRQAIALNPNYATARHWYSEYLTAMGRFDEAFVEARRAKEIDPLSPSVNAQEVWILFYSRRFDEAIERGRRIAEMNPDYAEIYDPLKRC